MRELPILMNGRSISHRPPRKVAGFTWSRVPTDAGGVLYRLFWRNPGGVLCVLRSPCSYLDTRQDIARDLRRVHNNCRLMRAASMRKAA